MPGVDGAVPPATASSSTHSCTWLGSGFHQQAPPVNSTILQKKLASSPAVIWPNSSQDCCAEVDLHGTVQRVQALLRTCCNENVAVYCDGILALENHRNCFLGRRTADEPANDSQAFSESATSCLIETCTFDMTFFVISVARFFCVPSKRNPRVWKSLKSLKPSEACACKASKCFSIAAVPDTTTCAKLLFATNWRKRPRAKRCRAEELSIHRSAMQHANDLLQHCTHLSLRNKLHRATPSVPCHAQAKSGDPALAAKP